MDVRVGLALRFAIPFALVSSTAHAEDPDQGGESKAEADVAAPPPPPPQSPALATKPAPPPDDPNTAGRDPALPPRIAGSELFKWAPFGFLRLQYKAIQNDPNVEFVGRDDGFELQNARLGVRGTLGDDVAFVVSFDGAVDEREQINVPEGKLGVRLRDAYGDYFLSRSRDAQQRVKSELLLRAGFFQTWAELQTQIPDVTREFVDRPIESRGIRATEGFQTQGLTPGRSLGAAIRLQPQLGLSELHGGFELAIQNGADEFSSNNDNDKPAVSAAGLLRFAKDGHVVAAVRYNPRTVGDLPFRQDETDLSGSAGLQVPAGPVNLGGGVVVTRTTFGTTGGPAQNAFGGHAQLTFRAGSETRPLTFGYRFGLLDPSSLFSTDRVMEHTVGGVLGVPRYRLRLQLQLTHVIEQAERDLSNSRAQLAVELSL